MNAAVCTMFEGDYHLGVGVLVNSLHANGYHGKIWAGYRGELPPWAATAKEQAGSARIQVGDGCTLHFVPLATNAHLTNFKPEFMLDVMDRLDPSCGALFYIDPDIVIAGPWRSFEEWITCGLAVCEDINSPMPLHHPQRIGWRRCFEKFGFTLAPRESCYANGGFIGVARGERRFLEIWKRLQDAMWTVIGSSEFAGIPGGKSVAGRSGFFDCFGKTDQDALNAAIEAAADVPVSFLGRQAMGFEPGSPLLPHALGPLKPWRNRLIWNAFRGMGCPVTDKHFWQFTEHPIRLYPSSTVKRRKLALRIAGAIARFMRRG
jgi:hypothetical protein